METSGSYNQNYGNQLSQGAVKGIPNEAPRTISSAVSRIESLNERLSAIRSHLDVVADQIGGPRPTSGSIKGDAPQPNSAVSRLNGSADAAHAIVLDIEESLKAISRALG